MVMVLEGNRVKKRRILFVCSGNSCRSPMAEAITAARMPLPWRRVIATTSAGTAARDGMPAAPHAAGVLAEIGIDLSRHVTRSLAREMVEEADLVIAMTGEHREEILRIAPGSQGKVIVFGELDSRRANPDISDPIGGDAASYRETRDDIQGLVLRLIDYLADIFRLTK
jgi:protein-tyrosine-phosphatase